MTDTFAVLQSLVNISRSRQSKSVADLTRDALALGFSQDDIDAGLALWRQSLGDTPPPFDRATDREDRKNLHPEPLRNLEPRPL